MCRKRSEGSILVYDGSDLLSGGPDQVFRGPDHQLADLGQLESDWTASE